MSLRLKLLCSGDVTVGCLHNICKAPDVYQRELLEAFLAAASVNCIPAPGGERVRCVKCGNRGCVFEVERNGKKVQFSVILVGDSFYCIPGEFDVQVEMPEA